MGRLLLRKKNFLSFFSFFYSLFLIKFLFFLLEIDDASFHTAEQNVALNQLQSRIRLVKTSPLDPLIPQDAVASQQ
jgi:hypothetical protein